MLSYSEYEYWLRVTCVYEELFKEVARKRLLSGSFLVLWVITGVVNPGVSTIIDKIDIIDDNRYQSISINWLILIIDDQSMAKILVVIDWYWLLIPIDREIGIDW